jgi:hypothetical protein
VYTYSTYDALAKKKDKKKQPSNVNNNKHPTLARGLERKTNNKTSNFSLSVFFLLCWRLHPLFRNMTIPHSPPQVDVLTEDRVLALSVGHNAPRRRRPSFRDGNRRVRNTFSTLTLERVMMIGESSSPTSARDYPFYSQTTEPAEPQQTPPLPPQQHTIASSSNQRFRTQRRGMTTVTTETMELPNPIRLFG